MDNLITLSCPSCGASLEVASETEQVSCEYCGNTRLLSDLSLDEASIELRNKRRLAQERPMTFFDFEMEDLRYNYNGKMGPYQKRRFFTDGLTSFLLIAVSGALGSIIIMTLRPSVTPACG